MEMSNNKSSKFTSYTWSDEHGCHPISKQEFLRRMGLEPDDDPATFVPIDLGREQIEAAMDAVSSIIAKERGRNKG